MSGVAVLSKKAGQALEAASVVYERESPSIIASLKDVGEKASEGISKVIEKANVIERLEKEATLERGGGGDPTAESLGITYVTENILCKFLLIYFHY